jgi:2-oxo-4-hydroxy-4-carboxy--5-ureidoimidazoline (OHCU) decarboxylase
MEKFVEKDLYLINHDSLLKILDLGIKNVETRIDGMDKALKVKEQENERRLEGLNELRKDVVKDRNEFVRQETYDLKMGLFDCWVTDANEKFTKLMTKYDNRFTIPTVIALISLIVSVIGIAVLLLRGKG